MTTCTLLGIFCWLSGISLGLALPAMIKLCLFRRGRSYERVIR